MDAIGDLVWLQDARGFCLDANPAFEHLARTERSRLLGQRLEDVLDPGLAGGLWQPDWSALQAGRPCTHETRLTIGSVSCLYEITHIPQRDSAGALVQIQSLGRAITQRHQRIEQSLRDSRRQLADVIDFLPDALLAIDRDKRVIIWNKAITQITGISPEAMLGRGDYAYTVPFYGERRPQLMDLVFMPDAELERRYAHVTREGDTLTAEGFCNALYDGRGAWILARVAPLRDAAGQVVGAIEIIRDITEHKRLEEDLRQLTRLDPLTQLFNRRYFFTQAEQEYQRFRRYHRPMALCMIDIDHFKSVNDRHGHLVGDTVLCAVAQTLYDSLRQVDILARYGGEEFVVLLPETDLQTARASAERLRAAVAERRIETPNGPVSVTLSLGVVAVDNGRSMTLEQLLDAADQMLYRAKQAGRDRVEIWDLGRPLESGGC
jgi:diguanylate cyclase (GGDEF)-like protein/PAS domain S-box-containing protein